MQRKYEYMNISSVQSLNHTMQLTTAVKTRDVSSIKINMTISRPYFLTQNILHESYNF